MNKIKIIFTIITNLVHTILTTFFHFFQIFQFLKHTLLLLLFMFLIGEDVLKTSCLKSFIMLPVCTDSLVSMSPFATADVGPRSVTICTPPATRISAKTRSKTEVPMSRYRYNDLRTYKMYQKIDAGAKCSRKV